MSWFKNAMRDLQSRKGARKFKTTVKRATDEGTVSVTVKGVIATTEEELATMAREAGATVSAKGGDFRVGEATQTCAVVDEDAAEFVANVCDPDSYSDRSKPAGEKRGVKADAIDAEKNGEEVKTE